MTIDQGLIDSQISNTMTASSVGAGTLAASAAGRAIMSDDYFTSVEVSTVGAGGKFDAGCITAAGLAHLVAADAFDSTRVDALFAAGAFGATADARAAIADDFFNSTMVSDSGAGGKFAVGCITAAGLAHLVAADAFDSTRVDALFAAGAFGATVDARAAIADDFFTETMVSASGAGGKFAPGCITTAGLVHLVADGAFTTAEFAAGVGGKFTAGALNNAGLLNLVPANAFDSAFLLQAVADGAFAAADANRTLFADDFWGATAVARAKFATDFIDAATADDIIAVGALGEDLLTASEIDARALVIVTETAVTGTAVAGADIVMKLAVEDVATGNQDFVAPANLGNFQIIDVWAIKRNGAGGAADTHQIQTGVGGAITNAMVTNIAEDVIVRCTSIDEAASLIASGGTIRIAVNDGAAGNTSVDCFVRVLKRA